MPFSSSVRVFRNGIPSVLQNKSYKAYTILQLDPEAFKAYAAAHKIFKNDRYSDRDSDRRRNDVRRDADKPAAEAEAANAAE